MTFGGVLGCSEELMVLEAHLGEKGREVGGSEAELATLHAGSCLWWSCRVVVVLL